jgi:ABC-2 type transport system ATP-binding protein
VSPDDYAIAVEDLGVRYNLRFTRKSTVRGSFASLLQRRKPERFWALRHVSVQVNHGESLAVIGPNGAGKSTFLQVLAGIMRPTEGTVDVRGQVSGLLGLGVGFDTELSGVENIRLGGAFLGLDGPRIQELLPEIIDFADLGQFIDAPLKTYSSGMRARLGFSIATAVDPDILLLDEVLATGDASFRAKSKARVIELVRSAKAVVLVTHDMDWVREYCNRAMLIEKGKVVMQGSPDDVTKLHLDRTREAVARRKEELKAKGLDLAIRPKKRGDRIKPAAKPPNPPPTPPAPGSPGAAT